MHERKHDLLLPLHALVVALGRVGAVANVAFRELAGERHRLPGGKAGNAHVWRDRHAADAVDELADALHIDRAVDRDRQVVKQARDSRARQLTAALRPVAVGIGKRQLRRSRADMLARAVENIERAHRVARDGDERHLLVAQVEHRKDVRIRLVGVAVDAAGILLDLLVHAHEQDRDDIGVVAVEPVIVAHRARAERLHIVPGNVHPVIVGQRIAADRRQNQYRCNQQQRDGEQHAHDDDQHARGAAHALFRRALRRCLTFVWHSCPLLCPADISLRMIPRFGPCCKAGRSVCG